MQNTDFWTRKTCLFDSKTSPVVLCMQNRVISTRITGLYAPSPAVRFLHTKQPHLDQNYTSLWVPDFTCGFVYSKQRFRSKIACVYASQTSPVILCLKNGVPSIRITSLYGSCLHLWFLNAKQRHLDQNNTPLWAPDTTCHFVHTKQRELHQKNWSQWVPALICGFCMQNREFWSRITSLHRSQTSPVILCMQCCEISTRITSLSDASPHMWFSHAKQRLLDKNNKSQWVPDITCRFVHAIHRD